MRITSLIYRILLIVALAFGLPKTYNLIFIPDSYRSQSFYSDWDKQFYTFEKTEEGLHYKNQKGETVSKKEYEKAIMFMHYQKLMVRGKLPDSLGGFELSPELLGTTNKFFRLNPRHINQIPNLLFPLSYQKSKTDKLENVFLKFSNKLSILHPITNKVIIDKTAQFQEALKEKYFQFPAQNVFGRHDRKNAVAEGVFVTDANNHFFNIFFDINAQPQVEIIPLPQGMRVEKMLNTNFKDESAYGILIDQNDKLYLLESNSYRIIPLPISNYNSQKDDIIWAGNILSTTVNITKEDSVYTYAFNSDNGNLIGQCSAKLAVGNRSFINFLHKSLFPFSLNTKVPYSRIAKLRVEYSTLLYWLTNSLCSLLVFAFISIRNKRRDWTGIILIALTGVYGLISILLVPSIYRK